MANRDLHFFGRLTLVLFIFGLQLGVMYLSFMVTRRIDALELGAQTFALALLAVVLNIASGAILVFFFLGPTKSNSRPSRNEVLSTAVLLGMVPALAVLFKLLLTTSQPGIPFLFRLLGLLRFQMGEWIIRSQVPSFWLGLIIGWLMRQTVNPE